MCSIHTAPDLPRSSEVLIQQSRWPTDRATIAYDAAFRAVNGCKDLVQVKSSIPVVVPPIPRSWDFFFLSWDLAALCSQIPAGSAAQIQLGFGCRTQPNPSCSQIHSAAKSTLTLQRSFLSFKTLANSGSC